MSKISKSEKDNSSNTLSDNANKSDVDTPFHYIYSKELECYVSVQDEKRLIEQKKAKDKAWDSLISQLLEDALEQTRQLIAYHQEQLILYLNRIEQHLETLQLLATEQSILEKEKRYFEEYGYLELDENGQLKNEEAEQLLQEWEAETGQQIDRSDPDVYYAFLQMLETLEAEQEQVHDLLEADEEAYEYHKLELDEAKQVLEDLQSNDTNLEAKAIKRLETLDSRTRRDIAASFIPNETKNNSLIAPADIDFETQDFEMDDFDFGFPDLQSDFNTSAEDIENTVESTPSNVPKSNLKILSM